jgi:hypothetical protein
MNMNMNMKITYNTIGQPLAICLCRQFEKYNLNTDSQNNYSNVSKNYRQAQILKSNAVRNYSYVNNINGNYRYCINEPLNSLGINGTNTNINKISNATVSSLQIINQSHGQNQTLSLQANLLCGPPKRYINALGSVEGQPGGSQVSLKNSF